MSDLNTLLAQKAELERKIDAAQKEARADAIAKVKSMMAEYGLTPADLNLRVPSRKSSGAAPAKKSGGGKVAAKYRDKATGETWSGRGLQPKWLKAALTSGRKIDEFAV
jgi:DNA-binding protein H-NS